MLRQLCTDDVPVPLAAIVAMEAAQEVLRGRGAVLKDETIRAAADYHGAKVLEPKPSVTACMKRACGKSWPLRRGFAWPLARRHADPR